MINTKTLHSLGFYIFESKVCANNNYIESLSESKMLLSYLNYYLNDYLKIYDYIITRHGFQLVVKLKDEPTIRSKWQQVTKKDKKSPIWKIISEQVRLCLSTYVKRVNRQRARTGVLVHSSYLKYYFTSLKEAKKHIQAIRNQLIKLYQRRKRYRGLKKHYKISQKIAKGSIFLCSKELNVRKNKSQINCETYLNKGLKDFVLDKFVNSTITYHNLNYKPPKDVDTVL